jgi:hypothetical protein
MAMATIPISGLRSDKQDGVDAIGSKMMNQGAGIWVTFPKDINLRS